MGEGSAEATLALHGHWLEEMESSIQPKSIQLAFNFEFNKEKMVGAFNFNFKEKMVGDRHLLLSPEGSL